MGDKLKKNQNNQGVKGNGGKRPGAGRPKGSTTNPVAKLLKTTIEQTTKKDVKKIVEALVDTATGHYQMETIGKDTVRVYKNSPNPKMLAYLIDRNLGKPKETVETNAPLTFVEACRALLHDTD